VFACGLRPQLPPEADQAIDFRSAGPGDKGSAGQGTSGERAGGGGGGGGGGAGAGGAGPGGGEAGERGAGEAGLSGTSVRSMKRRQQPVTYEVRRRRRTTRLRGT
jgi:hypothetical protein